MAWHKAIAEKQRTPKKEPVKLNKAKPNAMLKSTSGIDSIALAPAKPIAPAPALTPLASPRFGKPLTLKPKAQQTDKCLNRTPG